MNLDLVIFGVSALVAIFGAVMMIIQRNPVASVLFLIVSLVAQAVLYIQLSALFVAAVLIIVYSGAILVLFLFVIMLLNLRGNEDLGQPLHPVGQFTKFTVAILLAVEIVFAIQGAVFLESPPTGIMNQTLDVFGSVEEVAILLFTRYLYPFELTSILLLVAIVGAVVMAGQEDSDAPVPERDKTEQEKAFLRGKAKP